MEARPKTPTLRDVAKAAFVSPSTAAAALRGSPRVHIETRRRVQEAAGKMGYAIQMAARILRGGRPPIAAISSTYISSWAHHLMIQGMAKILEREDFNLLLTPPDPDYSGDRMQKVAEEGLRGGLIAFPIWLRPADSRRTIDRVLARGIPVVTIEFRHSRTHSVEADNRAGGRLAAEHLSGMAKDFLIVSAANPNGEARSRGFLETLRSRRVLGRNIKAFSVEDTLVETGMKIGLRIKTDSKKPIAIFSAWGDMVAWGILKSLTKRGLRARRDYFLVGFDDLPFTRYIVPGLTTVRQPLERMGECAAEILVEAFRNPDVELMRRVLPPELVIRDTA